MKKVKHICMYILFLDGTCKATQPCCDTVPLNYLSMPDSTLYIQCIFIYIYIYSIDTEGIDLSKMHLIFLFSD